MADILETPELSHRSRLQFSLRGLLLLIVIAGIGFSVWTSSQRQRQIDRLQDEVSRLKKELGELSVEIGQEDKLHVLAVPTREPMTWKWHVHVPADRRFEWGAFIGRIPTLGLNKMETGRQDRVGDYLFSGGDIPAGDYLLTVALRLQDGKKLSLSVSTEVSTYTSGLVDEDEPEWIGDQYLDCRPAGCGQTHRVERGEPLELLWYRKMPPFEGILAGLREDPPTDGLLVWLTDGGRPDR